jgi:hypothetical protein
MGYSYLTKNAGARIQMVRIGADRREAIEADRVDRPALSRPVYDPELATGARFRDFSMNLRKT